MSCNVLVIEDDREIQESLCQAIEMEGHHAVSAFNGKEGLDKLEETTDFSLILLDLMMPIMDGFEFLATRKRNPAFSKIPVILVSAFPHKAREVEAQGYMNKPIKLDVLIGLLEKYCI